MKLSQLKTQLISLKKRFKVVITPSQSGNEHVVCSFQFPIFVDKEQGDLKLLTVRFRNGVINAYFDCERVSLEIGVMLIRAYGIDGGPE